MFKVIFRPLEMRDGWRHESDAGFPSAGVENLRTSGILLRQGWGTMVHGGWIGYSGRPSAMAWILTLNSLAPYQGVDQMGFSFSYETTEPISPLLQQEIVAASDQLLSGRTWLSCEPPHLTNDGGRLRGSSKPNMMAHPDDVTSA